MARSRNIKPGFFKNETLADLGFAAQILFAGLWTLADREGRLEDRPRLIKAEIFPYQRVSVNELLTKLDRTGFITRYTVGERKCIAIVNWHKHQNPHIKEAESCLPAPCEHDTSTVQEQCSTGTSMEQEFLIPDSSLLIPDSLNLDHSSADAEVPPEKPKTQKASHPTKKTKETKEPDYKMRAVTDGIEAVYGDTYLNWKRHVRDIETLLKKYEPADIVGCWADVYRQRGSSEFVPLSWLIDKIKGWKDNGGRLLGQKGNGNGRTDTRSDTGASWHSPGIQEGADPSITTSRRTATDFSESRAIANRFAKS